MISNRVSEAASSRSNHIAKRRSAPWPTWLLLAAIVLLGASFSTLNLFGWDADTAQHPDERFMAFYVANHVKMPASFAEYLDSSRNPLNPRNTGNPFYVYGLLPQTLTHVTAVLLTPDAALPAAVAPADPARYGKLPLVANPDRAVPKIAWLQRLLNPTGMDLTGAPQVQRVGRAWSVAFTLLSLLVVFLIGRRLYGRRVGLLAALLLALAAFPIQQAHFFTVDAATAFFTLLSVYWAVRCAQGGGWASFTALGLSIGAAMACRVTMASLGMLAILAVALRVWGAGLGARGAREGEDAMPRAPRAAPLGPGWGVALLVLAGVVTILCFRLLQPDAFVGTSFFDLRPESRFISNIADIGALVSGQVDAPPSQQWTGRTPYLFALRNMIVWGMGLPLGLAAWIAWAIAGWLMARAAWAGWRRGDWDLLQERLIHLIPWFWVAFYFAWQGGQLVMTMRYYLQLYGLLALFAAWGLIRVADRARNKPAIYHLKPALRWAPLAIVVIATFCWAYAFTRIYTRPHSRVTASRWLYEHVPPGSKITSELWDDALPLAVDGRYPLKDATFPDAPGFFFSIQTYPYAEDDQIKYTGYAARDGQQIPGLLEQLDNADYVVLSSNRIYDSATRLPMRYPALTRYYHYLFSGDLGFSLAADISSYPTLLGIPIPDQGAEEAFSVYDHPRVLIFKKTAAYSRANAERLITDDVAWDEVYKLPTLAAGKVPTALRLTDVQWPAFRAAGTWAALFDPASLANQVPWLFWLLAVELIGLAAFALLFRLLPPTLPDRGFALAKLLGPLLVAYAAWGLASAGAARAAPLLAFSPASVWLCAGALVAAGAAVGWRARSAIVAFARARRAALLTAEGLFLAAYFGFVLLRALNPDLWHPARSGEKPIDLAFLTAVLKSPSFPPYDPWFAGGYVNDYYFGFVIVGALSHLTGILPATAYNLAVPTLFALSALGAWGVVYNLVAPRLDKETRRQGGDLGDSLPVSRSPGFPISRPRKDRRAIATGLLAAVFVVLLGPLSQALWFLPGSAQPPSADLPAACQISIYAAQQLCRGRPEWVFWDAPRLVGMHVGDHTTNEFPFYTFLFGDLQGRMIALPLALAALGLMVALIRQTTNDERRRRPPRLRLVVGRSSLVWLTLVVGALRATNGWDYPTYLGLSVLALGLVAWRDARRGLPALDALLRWAGASAIVVLGSALLFLPFVRSLAASYAGLALWLGSGTPTLDLLINNGLWLFMLASGALLLYRRRGASPLRLAIFAGLGLVLAAVTAALGAGALALLVPIGGAAVGLLVDMLFGVERRRPWMPGDERSFSPPFGPPAAVRSVVRARVGITTLLPIAWAVGGLLVALAAEIVVAQGDFERMNTVLNLGMQSWVLLAIPAALACAALWRAVRAYAGWAWRSAAVLLIGAALVYPLTATPVRASDRVDPAIGPTLDGAAFMRSSQATWTESEQLLALGADARAIDWLRDNVAGTPIVLEAHTDAYRWGGRVSIYSGLPTLLGWSLHETQQRAAANVGPILAGRQKLIRRLYTMGDQVAALRLLKLYGVEYVYAGQLEQALYGAAGLAKFEAMARDGQIQRVYDEGGTRIYQVPRDTSDPPPALLTTTLPVRAPAQPAQRDTRLDQPVFQLPAVGEYAWNDLAAAQPVAVLLWLLACYALLALGLPLALLVFGRRPGAGAYVWARLIGLLALGYAVWMPVSMRLWSYDRWGLLMGALLTLALDAAIVAKLGRPTTKDEEPIVSPPLPDRRSLVVGRSSFVNGLRAIGGYLASQRRAILVAEGLFLGGFALMTVIRALNPDLWQPIFGGEKPFEFGFLNAILRSPAMPPYDPFFSNGKINYYYYGYFLISLPVKATGIPPAVAFNLIVPTLFALTLAGAYAIVARLTGRLRYGLAGAAFVALLGNLAAAFPVGLGRGLAPVREALAPGLTGFGARLGDWFWGPSRVVYTEKLITINEFPLWSYLFADLHPHLIAMPIALLVVALAFELLDGRLTAGDGRRSVVAGRLSVVAVALGALAATNSWDFPTYVLVTGGALLGRAWLNRRASRRSPWLDLAGALFVTGAVALAALLLYLPFFQNYVTPAGVRGLGMVRDGLPVGGYLLIYGLFLAIVGPWIVAGAARLLVGRRIAPAGRSDAGDGPAESPAALGIVARPPSRASAWRALRPALWSAAITLALLAVLVVLEPRLRAALWSSTLILKLLLLALLAAGAVVLLARRLPRATWFVAWLAVVAWAVGLGVELVYIRDHLDGTAAYRMNTVFKFGLQAWMLMALAAAAALPWATRLLRRVGPVAQGVGWAGLLVLLALSLVFPLAGIPSRVAYRFEQSPGPTLDGLAFMEQAEFDATPQDFGLPPGDQTIHISLRDDLDAIRWLNENIDGTPIVLQSDLWFYRTYGVRIAANTGLPTVVSPLHASEQHDPQEVAARDEDVQAIYRTPEPIEALRLLSKYHVGYVYVGQIERAAYGPGVSKFDQLTGKTPGAIGVYLDVVYRKGSVAIYKVREIVYSITPAAMPAMPPFIARLPSPYVALPPPAARQSAQPDDRTPIAELERQVRADPTASNPAFNLARRYRQQGRLDEAATVLATAARANPDDVALHHLWGDILGEAGRLDEAEAAYRDALAADPSSGNYNKLGTALLGWGRLDQAAEAFQQAIAADASDPAPYFHLGQVYERQGLKDRAAAQYRAYLTIAPPGDPFRAEASVAIERLGK